ncbi:MAG: Trk system potassium transporter TrkA, partial [Burkholderiales bacterium]
PKGATIAALVRQRSDLDTRDSRRRAGEVIIAHHDTVIQADDHVIVFAVNKRIVPKVEKLFQVGVGFL